MSKTAIGLVNYAISQLGNPYWWGCYGQTASKVLFMQKQKQYPKTYVDEKTYSNQYGKRVHDCVGLIKGYLWSDDIISNPKYNATQDVSARGMYNAAGKMDKGDISEMPDQPGILVFFNDLSHVGVYIGGGNVVEARGHAWGVIKTKLTERPFKKWCRCKWIEYSQLNSNKVIPPYDQLGQIDQYYISRLPITKRGCTGVYVKILQCMLKVKENSDIAVDGHFGIETEDVLKQWQKKHKLEVDGVCGRQSWSGFFLW
jgi:peptidoglycan hydrolase-like protein with peptidoglycan-binding domain